VVLDGQSRGSFTQAILRGGRWETVRAGGGKGHGKKVAGGQQNNSGERTGKIDKRGR
jgi:hypothetical protein